MKKFPPNQKQPHVKQKNLPVTNKKAARVNLHPVGFPTSEGDLGILRIQNPDIPRMVKAPTRTGDGATNAAHASKMKKVLKHAGMLV